MKYGKGCYIPEGVIFGSDVEVGNHLTCRLGALISHDVTVEDLVFVGPRATCCSFSRLQEGCFIGAGVTILQGVSVGPGALIGAGATVVRDIPGNVVAVGSPAKVIREVSEDERRG